MPDIQIVASGQGIDQAELEKAEAQFKPGEEITFVVQIEGTPSGDQMAQFEEYLKSGGLALTQPVAFDSGYLVIKFIKEQPAAAPQGIGFAFLVALPWIITGIGAIFAGVFGWVTAKQAGNALASPIVIIAAIAVILVLLLRPRAPTVVQAGGGY